MRERDRQSRRERARERDRQKEHNLIHLYDPSPLHIPHILTLCSPPPPPSHCVVPHPHAVLSPILTPCCPPSSRRVVPHPHTVLSLILTLWCLPSSRRVVPHPPSDRVALPVSPGPFSVETRWLRMTAIFPLSVKSL